MRRGPGRRPTHGLHALRRALAGVRLDTLDKRSHIGVALRKIVDDLTAQLGGDVSAAQRVLIEQCAVKAVLVRSVTDWLLRQDTLLRTDGTELLRVVEQHDTLQRSLVHMLQAVGLDRVPRRVPDIREQLGLDDE